MNQTPQAKAREALANSAKILIVNDRFDCDGNMNVSITIDPTRRNSGSLRVVAASARCAGLSNMAIDLFFVNADGIQSHIASFSAFAKFEKFMLSDKPLF